MTDFITRANSALNAIVWGPPMLVLLMGTGLLLTVITGAIQFRHLGAALGEVLGDVGATHLLWVSTGRVVAEPDEKAA